MLHRTRKFLLPLFLLLSSTLAFAAGPPQGSGSPFGLIPRTPPAKNARLYTLPADTPVGRIVVKFHEGTHVRLRNGALAALARDERERAALAARGLSEARLNADLAAVQALVARESRAQGLGRLFEQDEQQLAAQRAAGEARGGFELADLDLYYEIRLPQGTTQGEITDLVAQLNAVESVEVAYADPVPEPAQAATPNLQGNQGYLNAAPGGIDASYAWGFSGGRGSGVRIVDLEAYWYTENHEDLPALFYRGVTTTAFNDHGTAVMGEMVGRDNGIGITGIANQAQAGFQTMDATYPNVANSLQNAVNAAGSPNGIVLIELHAPGPVTPACSCNAPQCGYLPMEYWQANYDVIATATANGTVIVEAAGNGSANLDDTTSYGNAFIRTVRDSGAILVGASDGGTGNPSCFTNYGGRVDLRGWGTNVATTGYGDLFNGGTATRTYTATFSGTSSASPIVAGAAAAVQGKVIADRRGALAPRTLRQLLRDTGTPQAASPRQIGPLPNLRQAINSLASYYSFEGYADGMTCRVVWGWAWDRNRPNTPIYVDVYDNGSYVGSPYANAYRADLFSAGKGNGYHAVIGYGLPFLQGQHTISVRYPSTSTDLGFSPRTLWCRMSMFTTQVPDTILAASPGYEVATQLSSSVAGKITGFRFYKVDGETGSHTIRLWSDTGAPIFSKTYSPSEDTAGAGWKVVNLPESEWISITAGTKYRVSFNTNTMQGKTGCGLSTPITNGPLTAHQGFWVAGTGVFPTNASCSNFFADIVFEQ